MSNGDTALHSAIRSRGDIERLLKHDNSHINAVNLEGETPLHLALQEQPHRVDFLLQHGADVNIANLEGETPLHTVVKNQCSVELVKLLLEHGADVDAADISGNTPLHLAVQDPQQLRVDYTAGESVVGLLLKHGSDVNAENLEGDTPIHLCLQNKTSSFAVISPVMRMLLSRASYGEVANSKDETYLHLAIRNEACCTVANVRALLSRGADPGRRDAMGENAYEAYCRVLDEDNRGADPMLQILLQSSEQQYMTSSLHVACLFHSVDSVDKLLRMGADVNDIDRFGHPPLFYALAAPADVGQLDDKCSAVRLMLDHGANINHQFTSCNLPIYTIEEHYMMTGAGFADNTELQIPEDSAAVYDVLIEHLVKLLAIHEKQVQGSINVKAATSPFAPRRKYARKRENYHEKCHDCFSRCCEELRAMGETKVGESELTLFDLLIASSKDTAIYARDKALLEAFQAIKPKFPMYQGMMDAKLGREFESQKLVESATVALRNALKFADLGNEFFEKTLSGCSFAELIRINGGTDKKMVD